MTAGKPRWSKSRSALTILDVPKAVGENRVTMGDDDEPSVVRGETAAADELPALAGDVMYELDAFRWATSQIQHLATTPSEHDPNVDIARATIWSRCTCSTSAI
jgi:hypothetical protein